MPTARKTDPLTSWLAARSIDEDSITETKRYLLKALNRPRTDVSLSEAYRNLKGSPRASESGLRTRRAELVAQGLVVDSGAREKLASGRVAIVWRKA